MTILIPDNVKIILQRLKNEGFEAYCVGGAVRDSIMGLTPGDWDITTSALPEETRELFVDFRTVDTGLKHGTLTVIIDKTPYEVTTFRIDGEYDDNRHPENVTFTGKIGDDLARRDFTVNALAYNEECGLVDLYGGQDDIYNSIIRTVGDADTRFQEDGLRIMRALRFSATLGFEIEEKTKKAIHKNKDLLKNISAERITVELTKLLCGKNAFNILMEYPDVLAVFIPEIAPSVNFTQYGKKHAYDVWEHICHTVDTIPQDRILRLTMLLHDLGKVPTHKLNEKGDSTFKNHATVGGEMAKEILTRLKFDKKTINRVSFLVGCHDFEPPETKIKLKKHLKTKTPEDIRTLLVIKKSDRGALSESYRDINEGTAQTLQWLKEIEENNECCTISQLAVNGKDLEKSGLKGEEIGNALNDLLDAVIENKVKNTKTDLLTYIL
ncbi:MAG: HD domain-containing protein [Ruminococcaceae bacterium]|nr:HD domain-containing protein [Oscillospiraceae bacterium]